MSDEAAGHGFPVGHLHPRTTLLLVASFATVLLASVMVLLPLPYALITPGPTTDTLSEHDGVPLISISGQKTYPTEGSLELTTVRNYGGPRSRVNPWQMVTGWLDDEVSVLPERVLFPTQQTAEQLTEENQLEMVSSQESATAAALRSLNYPVTERVRVAGFTESSPSAAVLETGDVIVSVSGMRTPDGETLRAELQKVRPGTPAAMVVNRSGKEQKVSAMTRASSSGGTALGILVEPSFSFPFQVKIQIQNVGGPSAGTMFALGIIDKLTPGALTGGRTVAGTGTIDPDGNVGPIGGIRQKLIGARQAGATIFVAPRDNCDEVVGHVPSGLSVIAVATLTQARTALEQISSGKGEEGLPRCR